MKRRRFVTTVEMWTMTALLALFACSCAAPAQTYLPPDPLQGVQTFKATRGQVWDACVGVLAESGAPIQVVEKESGLITTQPVIMAEGYGAKPALKGAAYTPINASPFAIWESVRYTLSIHVRAVTDSTTIVRITPHVEAFDRNIGRRWYACDSNGAIEAKIFVRIGDQLAFGK